MSAKTLGLRKAVLDATLEINAISFSMAALKRDLVILETRLVGARVNERKVREALRIALEEEGSHE